MSTSASFNIFCDTLKISSKKQSIITLRHHAITKKLNKDFWDLTTNYGGVFVGCYGRGTANDNVQAFRMIFEMPSHLQETYKICNESGLVRCLEDMRRAITTIYPKTRIDTKKKIILVKFSDGMLFEIIPSFLKDGNTYIYTVDHWKKINYALEVDAIKLADETFNAVFHKLCRMVKAWKQTCNVAIKNTLIDILVYRFLASRKGEFLSYSDFDKMCLAFFEYIMAINPTITEWCSIGGDLKIRNSNKFIYNAIIAHYKAETAIALAASGKTWAAHQKWREIFGYRFPESVSIITQLEQLAERSFLLHTTQRKCGHLLQKQIRLFISSQTMIGGAVLGSIVAMGYTSYSISSITLFIVAACMFMLHLYFKKYNLANIVVKHVDAASTLLVIKEQLDELTQDITCRDIDIAIVRTQKEKLRIAMTDLYKGTPRYINKKYEDAIALLDIPPQKKEDPTTRVMTKYSIPAWQQTKFYKENKVQCLMNYRNKMI